LNTGISAHEGAFYVSCLLGSRLSFEFPSITPHLPKQTDTVHTSQKGGVFPAHLHAGSIGMGMNAGANAATATAGAAPGAAAGANNASGANNNGAAPHLSHPHPHPHSLGHGHAGHTHAHAHAHNAHVHAPPGAPQQVQQEVLGALAAAAAGLGNNGGSMQAGNYHSQHKVRDRRRVVSLLCLDTSLL
jgi:hypothetical protein